MTEKKAEEFGSLQRRTLRFWKTRRNEWNDHGRIRRRGMSHGIFTSDERKFDYGNFIAWKVSSGKLNGRLSIACNLSFGKLEHGTCIYEHVLIWKIICMYSCAESYIYVYMHICIYGKSYVYMYVYVCIWKITQTYSHTSIYAYGKVSNGFGKHQNINVLENIKTYRMEN